MIQKIATIAILVVATGCGSELSCGSYKANTPPARQPYSPCSETTIGGRVHPQLDFYVEQFASDAAKRSVPCYYTFTIGFQESRPPDIGETVIGYCRPGFELRVMNSFWRSSSGVERMVLMYHELGHCALGLDHLDGEPDIMNTYLLDEVTADKQWDKLINNMFGRAGK
jgi:hypothetical protein